MSYPPYPPTNPPPPNGGQWGPPTPPSSYYQQQYNSKPGTSGLSITALVLGILSIFSLGFILGIPAIILGVKGKKEDKRNGNSTGMATGGVITGIVGSVLSIVYIILFVVMIVFFGAFVNTAYDTATKSEVTFAASSSYAYGLENGSFTGLTLGQLGSTSKSSTSTELNLVISKDGKTMCVQGKSKYSSSANTYHADVNLYSSPGLAVAGPCQVSSGITS